MFQKSCAIHQTIIIQQKLSKICLYNNEKNYGLLIYGYFRINCRGITVFIIGNKTQVVVPIHLVLERGLEGYAK